MIPESRRVHVIGGSAYCKIFTLSCVAFLAAACTPPPPASRLPPPASVHTEDFAVIFGRDTSAYELITSCSGSIMSDLDLPKPRVHIHYELLFGSDLHPQNLNMAIWRDSAQPPSAPAQIARTLVRSDSIITEVWHGPELQTQRYAVQPNTFPWMTSYTALLMHLVRMFYSKDIKDVRLFWIATGGHTSVAHLVRRTADSVIVAFDSAVVRTRVSRAGVLEGAVVGDGRVRVVKVPLNTPPNVANNRCGMGSFMKPNP